MHKAATLAGLVLLAADGVGTAQPYEGNAPDPIGPVVWYDGPRTPEGAVGVLIHINREKAGNPELHEYYVDSPYGMIVVLRADTRNDQCSAPCPDPVYVEVLPPGLYAEPRYVYTPENDSDWIVIYPMTMF